MQGGIFLMLLIEADNIKKFYGDRTILNIERLSVYTGDRIGIVGLNGAGKSTLLNILSGKIMPEEGFIKRLCEFSYYEQFETDQSEGELTKEMEGSLKKEFHLNQIVQKEYASGGERTKFRLAKTFVKPGHILLLDEPTSNVDLDGIRLLKSKLKQVETLLIISHDRSILDEVCTSILEVKDTKVKMYQGNYKDYERQKKEENTREQIEYERYLEEKKRLEKVYIEKKRKADSIAKIPRGMSPHEAHVREFLNSGKSYSGRQKNMNRAANAVKKRIEQLDHKDKPHEDKKVYMDFSLTNPPQNKDVIVIDQLQFQYDQNVIFNNLSLRLPNKSKIGIIGKNGVGKTTLLNLIHEAYTNAESETKIKVVPKGKIGYFHQNLEQLDDKLSVLDNVLKESVQSEESVRSTLAKLLFGANDLKKTAGVLSGGEKIRLAFAKLFVSEANILFFDEPTNYLDMPSTESLESMIKSYEGTVLIVSHDESFINNIVDSILLIENHEAFLYQGNLKNLTKEGFHREKSRKNQRNKNDDVSADKMRLELRITEIISRLGDPKEDKEQLEIEYQTIIKKLQCLNR
jgi:macrolide transport system ATP-binding/permease protein